MAEKWLNIYIYIYPYIAKMCGIFSNMGPENHPNVGQYAIHGAYGICKGKCPGNVGKKLDFSRDLKQLRWRLTMKMNVMVEIMVM